MRRIITPHWILPLGLKLYASTTVYCREWYARNRERRLAYQRNWYWSNWNTRRAYLNRKQREYRSRA